MSMKVFRRVRLERLAAKLILLGTVGLMVGLFGGSPSIVSDLHTQRENDGVGMRQKKIYEAILVAAEPDNNPEKAAKLREMQDESWSFYDPKAVAAPTTWQWAVTILSGLVVLTGQALGGLGALRVPKSGGSRRRSSRAAIP